MKNIPISVHVTGNDKDGYKLQFPITEDGHIRYSTCDTFENVIDRIVDLAEEHNIDLTTTKLVINL